MYALILMMLCVVPGDNDEIVSEHFDLVEINHFYDDQARSVFDQVIYKRMYPDGKYHVVDFRLIRDGRKSYLQESIEWHSKPQEPGKVFEPQDKIEWNKQEAKKPERERTPWNPPFIGSTMVPQKRYHGQPYLSIFTDGETLRKITCDIVMETWTQHDPELEDREALPKDRRQLLRPAKKIKSTP